MMATILKVVGFGLLVYGIVLGIQGNPVGIFAMFAGLIMDLQGTQIEISSRVLALEKKGKDNGNQLT